MPNIITALQADPADPNKVHIFLDDKHLMAVTLDVAAAERLTVGQSCSQERIERLHKAQELDEVYRGALNFLSYRPRSAREVEMRLRKKGHAPEHIESVMERLRHAGFVDDMEFARFWINSRMSFSPRGARLLRSELRQKGVPQNVVDEILREHEASQKQRQQEAEEVAALSSNAGEVGDESEDEPVPGTDVGDALALARKRMRTYSSLDPQTARRRLSGFLARRGYGYDTISAVTRRVLASEDEDESEVD